MSVQAIDLNYAHPGETPRLVDDMNQRIVRQQKRIRQSGASTRRCLPCFVKSDAYHIDPMRRKTRLTSGWLAARTHESVYF